MKVVPSRTGFWLLWFAVLGVFVALRTRPPPEELRAEYLAQLRRYDESPTTG